jgi:hypothetical protein
VVGTGFTRVGTGVILCLWAVAEGASPSAGGGQPSCIVSSSSSTISWGLDEVEARADTDIGSGFDRTSQGCRCGRDVEAVG